MNRATIDDSLRRCEFLRPVLSWSPVQRRRRKLIDEVADGHAAVLPLSWLLELEVLNGIELTVFVTRTTGQLRVTPELAAAATFEADISTGAFLKRTDYVANELEARFRELSRRHTARHGFRAYDLLHVSSALVFGCHQFWSFDRKARHLASLEGLTVAPNV